MSHAGNVIHMKPLSPTHAAILISTLLLAFVVFMLLPLPV
jgi:hypothetical protein